MKQAIHHIFKFQVDSKIPHCPDVQRGIKVMKQSTKKFQEISSHHLAQEKQNIDNPRENRQTVARQTVSQKTGYFIPSTSPVTDARRPAGHPYFLGGEQSVASSAGTLSFIPENKMTQQPEGWFFTENGYAPIWQSLILIKDSSRRTLYTHLPSHSRVFSASHNLNITLQNQY